MKQFKSIFLFAGLSAAIVVFWLAPGVNKAKSSYVRVFEDTNAQPKVVSHSTNADPKIQSEESERKSVKKYLKEKIKSEASFEDLEPEMFSRATHFHEEIALMDSFLVAQEDSVQELAKPQVDIETLLTVKRLTEIETMVSLDSARFIVN